MNSFETFVQLHRNEYPLVIGNVWDITSARIFEQVGFKALATSSKALAVNQGYEDGENIPFELLLETVGRIIKNINIPLSVDLEKGFGKDAKTIGSNLSKLHALGVVGVNIEDSTLGPNRQLRDMNEFAELIQSLGEFLYKKNERIFINARTDSYVLKIPGAMEESIKRARAYETAGAHGIFVPFLDNGEEIRQIVSSTSLPLNIFCTPKLPGFHEVAEWGVRRISMGGAIYTASKNALQEILTHIQQDQSFHVLYKSSKPA